MRELNTPISKISATHQYISGGRYKLTLNADGGINQNKSYYQYIVTNLPKGGYTAHNIPVSQLPATFKNKLKEIHNMVVAHAENNGLLQAGTDTDDI